MEEQTIKVTKCGECPFSDWGLHYGWMCRKDRIFKVDKNKVAKQCPLKGKTIKIEVE